jgi:hypothetical protein
MDWVHGFSAGWVGGGSGCNASSYGGFDSGFQAGAHFYFRNNIGLVLESGYPFALKAGVALKFGKQENQSNVSGSVQQSSSRPASTARVVSDSSELTILRLAKERNSYR